MEQLKGLFVMLGLVIFGAIIVFVMRRFKTDDDFDSTSENAAEDLASDGEAASHTKRPTKSR